MKTTTLLLAFLFALNFSFAQEMKIKYDIIMKSSDPEIQSQLQMSEGSSLTLYTKGEHSRTEMDMGGLMITTTIIDGEKKKGVVFLDGMLGKQAATFEQLEYDELRVEESEGEIEYSDETKEILGYTCKKAILYNEEEDIEMTFWYTEDIPLTGAYLGDFSTYGYPGIALEYVVEQSEVTMKFVAIVLEKSIKDAKEKFDTKIPAGYTVKSFSEIGNMSGQ